MTIGIDASRPNEEQKTGTEWYAYHIIENLKLIDHKNRYRLYSLDPLRDGLEVLPSNFESRVLGSPTDILWTQLRLSVEMAVQPPNVLFVPAHTIPLAHPRATILTVHDLGFEYFPELYKKTPVGPDNPLIRSVLEAGARVVTLGKYGNSEYDYHKWAMRFGVKHAKKIIAISKFTRDDVIKRYSANPDKITIIPHGFDANLYRQPSGHERIISRRVVDLRPYFLHVGRVERKKNIVGLLTAFAEYRSQPKNRDKLVLIGKPGFGFDEIEQKIRSLPPTIVNDIHILGWVPEEETAEFYRHASLFVFPSFFEGFGIPVIYAMASGVPVVCSNRTSLPEIAGDAAILVDPSAPKDLAQKIKNVMENSTLRSQLIEKGLRQAKKFNWRDSAQKTLQVLEGAYP